ncbi:TRAP dicarboxylate transporter subunit DctQ [Actibacterium atlanticum]|uniref:TRAP transporter small permease protein n=1 Tax=Actibacterium atlanticum TaxID=1461693 RepID=A0A058ZNT6_9RHOB|nr:TRAP transporter small permease [Actibacterium atlanticum]KCV83244.1 TRAP dicarboxylate transporter subunit DctQ [Actibacterium atlanticum]
MNSQIHNPPKSGFGRFVDNVEETLIALTLGLMALLTFANVVVRYVFNSAVGKGFENLTGLSLPTEILWGLEVTLVLFAWLVLFGISYGFKHASHLGVDAILNMLDKKPRKVLVIVSALICMVYALLLMKGAWDYWAPFAGFEATEGRWFPTGFNERTRDQGWYETEQIPIPFLQGWLENTFNLGEEYEKMPRLVPYVMLPVGAALLVLRIGQALWRLVTGRQESLIASHEAEDAVEEAAAQNEG